MKSLIYLVLILTCCIGCKKSNNDVQTPNPPATPKTYIYPLPYYPAYPGSYWIYQYTERINSAPPRDTTYITKVIVSSDYLPTQYLIPDPNSNIGLNKNSDLVYVPYVNGSPIFGYNWLYFNQRQGYWYQYPFFFEKFGDTIPDGGYIDPHSFPDPRLYYSVCSKMKDLMVENTVYDSVIILCTTRPILYPYATEFSKVWKYYAKNTGLVATYWLDINGVDTARRAVLTEYHINK